MMNNEKKPNLKQLRQKHSLLLKDLAKQAGVQPREVYAMEVGIPVEVHMAQKILHTFSQCVNQTYTLDDIRVRIKKDAGT